MEATSLNVAKEEIKINCEKIQKASTPKYLKKLYKSPPQLRTALIQSKGTLTNY